MIQAIFYSMMYLIAVSIRNDQALANMEIVKLIKFLRYVVYEENLVIFSKNNN